jgi:hypothetical protein
VYVCVCCQYNDDDDDDKNNDGTLLEREYVVLSCEEGMCVVVSTTPTESVSDDSTLDTP